MSDNAIIGEIEEEERARTIVLGEDKERFGKLFASDHPLKWNIWNQSK